MIPSRDHEPEDRSRLDALLLVLVLLYLVGQMARCHVQPLLAVMP